MKNYLKRTTTFILAILMLVSVPLQTFAEVGEKKINYDENPISDSGFKEGYINNKDIDVKVAKPKDGSQKFIEGPDIPDIYTMKAEYKIQRGDNQINNYQPYEASVGAGIKDEDKAKIKQTIKLPDFDGYTTPTPEFDVTHDSIVNKSKEGKKIEKKEGTKTWTEHKGFLPYIYIGKKNTLKVKHVFQSLEDQNKYGPMDGQTKPIETIETGLTGSIVTISPLESDKIKGYKPETNVIETQMPEHTKNYVVEYRYNRKHFDVHCDTKGGSPIATRTIYYGQRIPTIPLLDKKGKITTDTSADPTYKVGSIFQGWKPSIELKTKDGKKFEKDKIIKDKSGNPIKTLDANLIMPADNVTFTAVWKDKEKADYAVQFWAEKADHDDNAGLEKYDYIGTHVYKNEPTGKRPDLDKEPVKDIVFPDLDKARLGKIWGGEVPYLNKFYVYNQDLTHEQNKGPKNVNLVKSVDSTGETVYNIYYDRQVYDLYFTKSNVVGSAFYPEIWKNDKKVGEEGNPYHFKARFNQSMVGLWPDDVKEVRGFNEGNNSLGWLPNLKKPKHFYRDTPPYRLSANLFIDCPDLEKQGGYVSEIDLGNGQTKPASITDLSFGLDQSDQTMPHQIDFWLDDFDGEQVIDYDLYTIKSDTNNSNYHDFLPPDLQGFTPKNSGGRGSEFKEDSDLDDLNEEREEITAPKHVNIIHNPESDEDEKDYKGKLKFMKNFPGDDREFAQNGYLKFEYSRNKYPLRFNYDPSIIRDDSYFNDKNQLDTFYEFPLKALSPDADTEKSYKTGNPKNILDNPEKLKELGLTDLVFKDTNDNNKLKVKRPDNLSDQMVFKGWALDPAGTILVRDKKSEKMPSHAVNLYAKWGEPDNKWKVTIDPNGGYLSSVKAKDLTKTTKTIQEGDIGQEEEKTYPIKEKNDGKKQIFTVVQRQQLNKLEEPQRLGYDFLGWEWVKINKDGTENKTYSDEYGVPELYSFGNDIVSNVYLKAIWVKNDLQTVMAYHHILDKDLKEVPGSPESQELPKRRKGYFAAALGSKQGSELTLVPKAQWEALKQSNDTFKNYYNEETGRTNNYFQVHEIKGPIEEKQQDGPDIEKNNSENDFHFFYIPYRKREYKVNYLDERCKADVEKFIAEAKNKFKENYEAIKNDSNKTEDQKREAYRNLIKVNEEYFERIVSKYSIIAPETVINGKRHYDARNYRHIPGWTLAENESPQQQLFFNVDESTNEFLGINGTGLGEVFFFYQDARVIEVKNPEDKVPEGYVRVTFKADKGGSFGKDAKGDDIKVLYYDVIKGLKSDSLPVPQKWEGLDNLKDKDKNYITPDYGKNFVKWDNKPLLNKGTILQTADNNFYVFTAYFDWSGLSTSSTGLVRTEAFKDEKADSTKDWSNKFAPTIDDLKKQLVWKEKDKVKPIPVGTKIEFVYKDDAGKETKINTDEDVFNLVKEMGKEDKDEVVRVVNIVAKVTFEEGKNAQELTIPITVYKNRYEALNKEWQKPKYLSDAEGKDAKDGGLKDVTGNYVMVTVSPSGEMKAKDNKVYYVNPKAWVEIPEVNSEGSSTFINWTADQVGQNDDGKEKGKFDFEKRHKFTKDTVITPVGAGDVVEQEKGKDKPDVPKSYVKVIVKTTDKATDETAFEKTFWVNPTKEVTIQITEPTGKENQKVTIDGLGEKDVNYIFKEWQKVKTGEADDKLTDVTPAVKVDLAKNKFTDKVTVIEAAYKKSIQAKPIVEPLKTKKLDTPQGKEITDKDLIDKITPPENKEIESITVVEKPDLSNPGKTEAKVIVKYKDGTTQGTNDNPVVIPVEVHKNIIPEAPGGQKPKDALDNYVKVIFTAGTGGTVSGDLVYYVSPEVEVDMTDTAKAITKTANIGYFVNGEKWTNTDNKTLKGTFTDPQTEFVFNFDKSDDIVEKTDDPNQVIPKDYVKVTFKTEDEAKGKLAENKLVKIYYVNPKAGIKLVELAEGTQAAEKQLAVPKTVPAANYEFDKWYESIDKENPITNNREYVARFVKGGVNLTYDANGATGTVPSKVIVAQGTSVRLASAAGLSKKDYTFAGWKFDGDDKLYQAGDEVTLDVSKTAVAQWKKDKDIISYNPEEPKARPDNTYVRVIFKADKGLSLTESKAYYVKKGKGITLANASLVKPVYKEETGYKFDKWDKEDSLVIAETDIVVTAKATKFDKVIPEKKDDGNKNDKPAGYKEVTFVVKAGDEAKGSITGVAKFYVNPTEYVTINPPTTKANTGFKFGTWDKDATIPTVYKEDATITGSFNGLKDVIPKTNPDGSENKQPAGYKKVEFVIEPAKGGSIVKDEVTVYYVNPAKEVTVPQPKTAAETGYEFEKWDQDTATAKKYTDNTTVKGKFAKLPDIVPGTNDKGENNPKPEGYVTVTFEKGDHGTITGQTVYYVNPNVGKKLSDIKKPEVKPEIGYKFTGWDTKDDFEIKDNKTVIAQYESIDDVIPKTKEDGSPNEEPKRYITVTFVKGDHGKELTGQAVYYVNPNKAVVLKGKAPTAVPNTGYKFARWDVSIDQAIQYKDGAKITALYNEPGNISKTEVEGYVKVEFKPETNGALEGTTNYWIKPGVEVNIPAPSVKPNVGYKFDKWDKPLTVTANANDPTYEITADYTTLDNIIPQKNTDGSDKPDGYVTVKFDKGDHGKEITGETVYYVNPNAGKKLSDITKPTIKSEIGWKQKSGAEAWDKADTTPITGQNDIVVKAKYEEIPDVVPEKDKNGTNAQPDGYIKVTLIPTDKATDQTKANKVFFVNPKKEVTIPSKPTGKTEKIDNFDYLYTFKGWKTTKGTIASWTNEQINGTFIQETEITAQYSTSRKQVDLMPAPTPKKDAVTPSGDTPEAKDLIKNVPGSEKDPLPNGTKITYEEEPKVDKPGDSKAKVKIEYPNGKTVVVEVPVKVVENVVPQTGNDKPLVPDSYVMVTVDTTDTATDNTKFEKVFWVKPNAEVTIAGFHDPTGKVVKDNGVKKTNKFVKWKLAGSNPEKFYENGITDRFTRESKIIATYEQDKNVEPHGNMDQWIPQGSNPSAKDFIKNPYNDNDPNNKDNLPPGTQLKFVDGFTPNTSEQAKDKITKVEITYPNGEKKIVEVKYNVTGDVVEQTDPNTKPQVPDDFVKVIVDKTDKAQLLQGEQQTQTFWVNPRKEVTIPARDPKVKDKFKEENWKFSKWNTSLKGTFTEETTITAIYGREAAPIVPQPNVKYVITDVDVQPTKDKYLNRITPPFGKEIVDIQIVNKPDVSKRGESVATIKVDYKDGTSAIVKINVIVFDKNMPPDPNYPGGPIPIYPEVRRETIIQEKVVKVPVPVSDNYFKEVRYMQGFNGYFRPNDGLTRAEAAQILANALVEDGYKYNPNFKISYKDVGEAWYTRAVKIVTGANVFAGYDDGNFKPQAKITRNEWIATLKRFQELGDASGNNMKLRDGHWAKGEIQAAFNEGWLKIYTDGLATYKGDEFIPRQEVAAVSNKAFKRMVDKTYIGKNNLSLVTYKDVNTSMWAYEDILCASNTFLDRKDRYIAHWVKEDKNQFNIDTSDLVVVQKNFQRNPR